MRMLVLTFYFEPDLSAGSFRTTSLVRALARKLPAESALDVITTRPNRYHSYRAEAPDIELRDNRVEVLRIPLPAHRGGLLGQVLAFMVFALRALWYLRGRRYDLVYATSSRLMTAVLGAFVARRKQAVLFLDIRDIFVDTLQDILPKSVAVVLRPMFQWLERYAIGRASGVNLVSEGFRDYFEQRYPGKRYSFIPNGIDEEFIGVDFSRPAKTHDKTIVLYAGNIGKGQGLHRIIPGLAKVCQTHEFWIVGEGGQRVLLEQSVAGLPNVRILSPVSRDELIALYREADVLFLHLNDFPAFRKVLPSKVFEYAATGKPILAGVAGYATTFMESIPNVEVFPPCDVPLAIAALNGLSLRWTERTEFTRLYRREDLMGMLISSLLADVE